MGFKKWISVDRENVVELHELLCSIPWDNTTSLDNEPVTHRPCGIDNIIRQLEEMIE